jgi:hypothetical protein
MDAAQVADDLDEPVGRRALGEVAPRDPSRPDGVPVPHAAKRKLWSMEISAPTVELLTWVSNRERTYADVVEAWKSNCPRLAVWDDAVTAGLVRSSRGVVALTAAGRAALADGYGAPVSR